MTTVDTREDVLAALGRHWNPTAAAMLAGSGRPIEGHADGTRVWSEDGAEALDLAGSFGVFLVGHGNPRVRAAVLDALYAAPNVPPGAVHPATAELCLLLREVLPSGLAHFALGCSGADVTETALRAVRLARPERPRIVVLEGGYHGKTLGSMPVLGQRHQRLQFEPLGGEVVVLPYGNAAAVEAALADGSVAAVIVEPVLGGGYLTVPPAGYLATVARACADTGTLLVADEIQTGFGRTGRMFAVDHDGVTPDIMLLSKSLTGGTVPVAVCALSGQVVEDARRHPEYDDRLLAADSCSSALAVAAAVATIIEVRERDLPARAAALGARFGRGLAEIVRRHPRHVLDAPAIGLMAGLRTRNPAVELMLTVGLAMRGIHAGFSLSEEIRRPVLRLYPPLTCTDEEIDRVLATTEEVLADLDRRSRLMTTVTTWLLRRQYGRHAARVRRLIGLSFRLPW
ncbi:aminotransferase class III-fold pyridoxal phosphate-dependent enzyme [Micromonospora sp. DT68]|uniref:aminotransferase class III-fold pyridoxal phosphate-dependent enzyme n=1 Tax=Micromonospora TaxID=1873 RepID=UPI0006AFA83B|nr:aminotransferase class III-fold pyridoxal phosphate-dependent enzyme [Micromonospora sp. NRRL B-16802]